MENKIYHKGSNMLFAFMLRIAFILCCVFLFLSFVFVQNLLWKKFWKIKTEKKGKQPLRLAEAHSLPGLPFFPPAAQQAAAHADQQRADLPLPSLSGRQLGPSPSLTAKWDPPKWRLPLPLPCS